MEKDSEHLSRKPLRIIVPKHEPRAVDINLCDAREVLTPEEYRELQLDLGRLAAQRRLPPPNDEYVD